MSTKRPQSTISFNTGDYLELVLKSLVDDSLIQSWAYIRHYAEKDTTKDHYHLFVSPCCPVDPVKLRKRFIEPCPDGDLICLPFQSSKINDWLLYALHWPVYLTKKGMVREFNYTLDDLRSNEPLCYWENIFFNACEELGNKRTSEFIKRIENGDSYGDILASGLVPTNQILFYDKLYNNYFKHDDFEFHRKARQQDLIKKSTPYIKLR